MKPMAANSVIFSAKESSQLPAVPVAALAPGASAAAGAAMAASARTSLMACEAASFGSMPAFTNSWNFAATACLSMAWGALAATDAVGAKAAVDAALVGGGTA